MRSKFLFQHRRLLFFGFVLTFFSCFGQTIIVSLYVPELKEAFLLNNTEISSLYAIATIGSAFLLPWIGRYIDTWPLLRFTIVTMLILASALLLLSFTANVFLLVLGLWGLRFGGQGLMTHTAASTMVRGFTINRGKALSLSALGFPASEVIMPLLVAFLIGTLGWRMGLQLSAGWMLLVVLPLSWWLIRTYPEKVRYPGVGLKSGAVLHSKTIKNPLRLLGDRRFWFLSPIFFLRGFIGTAIFFFQIQFGESRGWDASWMAGSISAFAIASAIGMLISGPMVDRLTARMVFPFFMLPYLLGLALLIPSHEPLLYPAALLFLGFATGMGNTIKDAVLAEIYTPRIIGSVRSLFTMIIVFSTALGPITFGLLNDQGWSFEGLYLLSTIAVLLSMIWSLGIFSSFTKGRWRVLGRKYRLR